MLIAVIAPGFHSLYLETMAKMFADCSERMTSKFDKLLEVEASRGDKKIELDLEAEFSNLALDIIGLGVFNYDFGSVTKESPVIKVCSLHINFYHNLVCFGQIKALYFICRLYMVLFLRLSIVQRSTYLTGKSRWQNGSSLVSGSSRVTLKS